MQCDCGHDGEPAGKNLRHDGTRATTSHNDFVLLATLFTIRKVSGHTANYCTLTHFSLPD